MLCPLLFHAQEKLSLDGEWQILFDDLNIGADEDWISSEVFDQQNDIRTIQVPSAWELTELDYEGVAFYKHSFDVPADWENKIIRLHFGAVNYLSEVWLNGEAVGYNEGGFTPFEFRVDEMIELGNENTLMLRVVGPIILSDKKIDGIKKMETAQWRGGITGGIYQSVTLIASGDIYIDDVFIQPNIQEQKVSIHTTVDHTSLTELDAEIEIHISNATDKREVITLSQNWHLHPGINQKKWELNIPNAKHWSPQNPHLYRATVTIRDTKGKSDEWAERFGMREFTIKNKDFYLNDKPIYIKAAFFEAVYPNGISNPDSEAMARREIQLAKEAGFNMIRPWRKPATPMWLDLADEMGVLVVGSPALECMTLPLSTAYLPSRVEHEVREAVLRDRNRACIVQWELFNELHRPVLKQLMRPMANLVRTLDPTRLILDESGGWAFGANIYLPNEFESTKFNDIHNYPGPFINEDRYDGYLSIGMTEEEKKLKNYKAKTPGRNVVPGLMSFVSELGYGSLPDLIENNKRFTDEGNPLTPAFRYHKRLNIEQRRMLLESGFSKLYPDMRQFYLDQQHIHGSANKRMIEAVRANPEVDGYCIHALSAGDWILGAGLIDLWRNPKSYAYEGTKAANQPQIVSIRLRPRNVYADQGAKFEVIGINDYDPEQVILDIEIFSTENKEVVYTNKLNVNYMHRISQLFSDSLETTSWNGSYIIKATLYSKYGEIITSNEFEFDVFDNKELATQHTDIAVTDMSSPLVKYLNKIGVKPKTFDESTNISTPVLAVGNKFKGITAFIKKGGTVIYLEGQQTPIDPELVELPFNAKVHPSQGLWTCIPHLIHDHPFFEGLPSNTMMRNTYENIWPNRTLRDITVDGNPHIETIVASVGFDWFSRSHEMQYSGPGASWWGSDIAEIHLGKGKFIVSQLRLVENLGKDPVADKILTNMINHIAPK